MTQEATVDPDRQLMTAIKVENGALQVSTMAEQWLLCRTLSKSSFVPQAFRNKPEDVLIATMYGSEVGLSMFQSLVSIAVINGKPSIYGDAVPAIARQRGAQVTSWFEGPGTEDGVIIEPDCEKWDGALRSVTEVTLTGGEVIKRTFSVADAKRSRLWMKKSSQGRDTPWVTYPQRMMQWRSLGWGTRDAGLIAGLYLAEEAGDIPTEPRDITPEDESEPENPMMPTATAEPREVLEPEVLPPEGQEEPAGEPEPPPPAEEVEIVEEGPAEPRPKAKPSQIAVCPSCNERTPARIMDSDEFYCAECKIAFAAVGEAANPKPPSVPPEKMAEPESEKQPEPPPPPEEHQDSSTVPDPQGEGNGELIKTITLQGRKYRTAGITANLLLQIFQAKRALEGVEEKKLHTADVMVEILGDEAPSDVYHFTKDTGKAFLDKLTKSILKKKQAKSA